MTSLATLKAWRKRTETLHRKAELLMSAAIDAFGTDDPLTDELDNVLVATADTLSHLDRRIENRETDRL